MAELSSIDERPPHCSSCAARFGECNCTKCARSLQLITWYGQVPGNILSRCMFPHCRQWVHGVDLQALLRSNNFFTTAFTMRYVQWALLLLALGQLCVGLSMLPAAAERLITTTSAKCAVARVTPHSLRNGEPVSVSINVTDWEVGLLWNKCKVPGGKLSVLGAARVIDFNKHTLSIDFKKMVEFNGFYLTSHSSQSELDPLTFTLECLLHGEGDYSPDT